VVMGGRRLSRPWRLRAPTIVRASMPDGPGLVGGPHDHGPCWKPQSDPGKSAKRKGRAGQRPRSCSSTSSTTILNLYLRRTWATGTRIKIQDMADSYGSNQAKRRQRRCDWAQGPFYLAAQARRRRNVGAGIKIGRRAMDLQFAQGGGGLDRLNDQAKSFDGSGVSRHGRGASFAARAGLSRGGLYSGPGGQAGFIGGGVPEGKGRSRTNFPAGAPHLRWAAPWGGRAKLLRLAYATSRASHGALFRRPGLRALCF